MTFYVDGLMPSTRTIVARFREEQPRFELTFERLDQHAHDEGDAFRARLNALRKISSNQTQSYDQRRTPANPSRTVKPTPR